jgi:hypothetical protein
MTKSGVPVEARRAQNSKVKLPWISVFPWGLNVIIDPVEHQRVTGVSVEVVPGFDLRVVRPPQQHVVFEAALTSARSR